jgi:hypothetical protein
MARVLTTLPPNQDTYLYASFKSKLDKTIDAYIKTNKVHRKAAKNNALGNIIQNTDDGLSLKELTALSGFNSQIPLHCDNCTDEDRCQFLRPEFSDGTAKCGCCWKHNAMCTFSDMPSQLIDELRAFPYFRAHVPCHRCWKEEKECNNDQGCCNTCREAGVVCEREACSCYAEPRDDSLCEPDCDKAHYDDGYENLVYHLRDNRGSNVRRVARQKAGVFRK